MELLLTISVIVGFVVVLRTRSASQRDAARIDALEASIAHLHHAGLALTHRVSVVETGAAWRPSGGYRTNATHAPFDEAAMVPPIPHAAIAETPRAETPFARTSVAETLIAQETAAPEKGDDATASTHAHTTAAPVDAPAPVDPADAPRATDVEENESAPTIEWERWIGVRGAAALGAGILVIAFFYFLRYSITVGWLTLGLRVALGGVAAAACVGVAEWRFRKTHTVLASWLTGAGIAGLYASIWSAQHLAGLLGPFTAFALVLGVTAGCVALALRDGSLPIAWLGTAGGFAAPLSLSMNGAYPHGVVAYVLVLDLAMVVLAAKKRWWSLAILSMLLTVAYDAVWLTTNVRSDVLLLQIGVLVVFAGVFGGIPSLALGEARGEGAPPEPLARLTRYGAVGIPFAFAAWLVLDTHVANNAAPVFALLMLVTILAVTIAHKQREEALPLLAAGGAALVSFVWLMRIDAAAGSTMLGVITVGLALPHLALVVLEQRRAAADRPGAGEVAAVARFAAVSFLVAAMGLVVLAAVVGTGPFATYLSIVAVLALLMLAVARVGHLHGLATLAALGTVASTLGIALTHAGLATSPTRGAPSALGALFVSCGLFAAIHVVGRFTDGAARRAWLAAARRGSLVLLAALTLFSTTLGVATYASFALALAISALAAVDGRERAYPTIGALLALSMGVLVWLTATDARPLALGATLAIAAVFLLAPLARPFGLLDSPSAPRGQLLAMLGFAAVLAPRWIHESPAAVGLGCAALAATSLGLALALRHKTRSDVVRREASVWLLSAAITFTTASLALVLTHEHLAWGFAAFGALLVFLGARRSSNALLLTGVGHVVFAGFRVVANPDLLRYHPRGDLAILNWITPAFMVPAAFAGLTWWWIRRVHTTTGVKRTLRLVPATVALTTLFVWLNVAVLDVFSSGAFVGFDTDTPQARDLAISFVWAVFGLTLLGLGMRRQTIALRWASLVLVLGTAGKVFLYDLGNLEDLYRVASLAGLSLSLLGISVLYQRFVFRRPTAASPAA